MMIERAPLRHPMDESDVTLRAWREPADAETISNMLNTCMAADGIDIDRSPEHVRNYLAHFPGMDPTQDTFLLEMDGELVAYGDVTWTDEINGPRVYRSDPYVLPRFRKTGVPSLLLNHMFDRVQALAAEHSFTGPRAIHVSLGEKEHELREIVESLGFKPERTFYRMVRPNLENIPDLPLPDGLEIRPTQPEHYRAIYNAMKEAFEDHWGSRRGSEDEYQLWLNDPDADPELWQIAWKGDQVAGMVLNFIDERENRRYDRSRGYTEDICVRRPWRRKGLARALIAHSLTKLADAGMKEAALGVDSDNQTGALNLYEGLGYEPRWKFFALRKPF